MCISRLAIPVTLRTFYFLTLGFFLHEIEVRLKLRTGMAGTKKRKEMPAASAADGTWCVKALPTLDSTLLPYRWPHGRGALVEERKTVKKILQTAHDIRMPPLRAWPQVPPSTGRYGVGFLGMYLSADDVFLSSDHSRNMLVDRAYQCFNVDWKLEVQALSANANDGLDAEQRTSLRFRYYQMTEDHLYEVVDLIDTLQSLYELLKPETVDLITRCTSAADVHRSMIMPNDASSFWRVPQGW